MIIRKFLLLGSLLVFLSHLSFGQMSFSHSFGGAVYLAASGSPAAPGFTYSPRLNFFDLGKESTISIGTHLGLGLVYNSRGEGGNSFAFDLPIVAEVNFGHGAHANTDSSFGGFFGLGYGINQIGADGSAGGSSEASGLIVNGGVRAIIKDRPVGFRVSYLLNSKEAFENIIGVSVFYTFGDF